MTHPDNWMTIVSGWVVADADGRTCGEVSEVVGDPDASIFDGLYYISPDGDRRFLAAANVRSVEDGRVEIDGPEPAGGGDVPPA